MKLTKKKEIKLFSQNDGPMKKNFYILLCSLHANIKRNKQGYNIEHIVRISKKLFPSSENWRWSMDCFISGVKLGVVDLL